MTVNRKMLAVLAVAVVLMVTIAVAGSGLAQPTPIEQLGEHLYFDESLSEPNGQSCASCHDPAFGFVDPDSDLPVSQGVLPELRFGNRNSPSSAYAMYAPDFHWDPGEGLWFGGQFWDGRATGEVLGDPLADQALGPFLNPLEMNNLILCSGSRDKMKWLSVLTWILLPGIHCCPSPMQARAFPG